MKLKRPLSKVVRVTVSQLIGHIPSPGSKSFTVYESSVNEVFTALRAVLGKKW